MATKLLYFADGNGANLTTEAYVGNADKIAGIEPITTTTTILWFNKDAHVDDTESKDYITFTHDNTTATTGHRCREIAAAVSSAANAWPHQSGMVDIVDLDNSIFYGNLKFVTGITITLDANRSL